MEATRYAQWFEQMMAKLGHELWVGDAARDSSSDGAKQKAPEERDLRQRLRDRHKLVCLRTSLRNQLQALAMGQGVYRKKKLWATRGRAELEALGLAIARSLGISCCAFEPSTLHTHTSLAPLLVDSNAIMLPSGESLVPFDCGWR